MFRVIKELWKDLRGKCDRYYFLTIIIIAQNNLSRHYRDSVLGVLWILIQPMTQVMIYSIIMPHIMRFTIPNYTLYLVTSIFTWTFISQTLTASTYTLICNAETIKRCIISKTIFPIAETAYHLSKYLISFACMCVIFLILGVVQLDITLLILPLYLIPIFITLIAAAIALSFAAPYLKDLSEIVIVGTNISFWLTPIAYPIAVVPERFHYLFEFNPFYIMIRPVITLIYQQSIPRFSDMTSLLILLIVTCLSGYFVYRICRKNFVFYL